MLLPIGSSEIMYVNLGAIGRTVVFLEKWAISGIEIL